MSLVEESSRPSEKEPAGSTAAPEWFGSAWGAFLGEVLGKDGEPPPDFPGYKVMAVAGRGAFGTVYRARDERLGREVALKVLLPHWNLDPARRARFLEEARALARIRHPHVLAIHAVLEHQGRTALVTEFIEGMALGEAIREEGPLGPWEAAQAGVAIASALAAVHASGLVHRDVKTANVLRERGGRLVLTDFGLGAFLSDGPGPTGGPVAGSPLFMAPEQLRGAAPDPRMDLYALGVVLYHLTTGRFPVSASSLHDLFEKIRSGALVPLRDARADLPEAFTRVVEKALAARPEERFQTAGEMERALLEAISSGARSPSGGRPSGPAAGRRGRARRLGVLAGAAVAGVLLLVLVSKLLSPAAFHAEAELWLDTQAGPRPLRSGDRLTVGSGLHLDFHSDRPLHVYVLNEDQKGERFLLFPHPRGQLQNPLSAGTLHRLPGLVGGLDQDWKVTSAGGEELVLVLASSEPLKGLEEALRTENAPSPGEAGSYPLLGPREVSGVLRGIGGLEPRRAERVARGEDRIAQVIDELEAKRGSDPSGLWLRKFRLSNP
jgi:hypothetical protein